MVCIIFSIEITNIKTSITYKGRYFMKFSIFLMAILLVFSIPLVAASPFITPNPLANLPSAPGQTVTDILALEDNKWLELPAPTPDPTWGSPPGAPWGAEAMISVPDLHGAWRTGEPQHAHVKSNGYGADDYWFFDINQHQWICLYPGTDIANFNQMVMDGDIRVDSLGRGVDVEGQPVPCHLLIHAWGFLAYDSDLKTFTFPAGGGYGEYYMPGLDQVKAGLDTLKAHGLNASNAAFAPWSYDPKTGRFVREQIASGINDRSVVGGYAQFEYIPTKKEFFYGGGAGVAFYNPATKTWRTVASPGTGPSGYDFGGCYDSKRDCFYMGQNETNFYSFDMKTEKWTKISGSSYSPQFRGNSGTIVYDSNNDMVFIFSNNDEMVYPINPETMSWLQPFAYTPDLAARAVSFQSTFYDPNLGVIFVLTASRNSTDWGCFVYKYKHNPAAIQDVSFTQVKEINLSVTPNPFYGATTLNLSSQLSDPQISIFNIQGKQLETFNMKHETSVTWNADGHPTGLYIARINAGRKQISRPLFLMK
jgi:hypothetical protein